MEEDGWDKSFTSEFASMLEQSVGSTPNGAGAALGDHAHRDGSGNGLFTLVIGVFLQCIVVVGNPFLYSEGTRSHDIVRIAVGLAGCCYGCFLYDT